MTTDQKKLRLATDSIDKPYKFLAMVILVIFVSVAFLLYPTAVLIGSWASSGPAPGWVVAYYVAAPFIALLTNMSKAVVSIVQDRKDVRRYRADCEDR